MEDEYKKCVCILIIVSQLSVHLSDNETFSGNPELEIFEKAGIWSANSSGMLMK